MTARRYSEPVVWSSLCLLPAAMLLAAQGSLLSLLYAGSALVSLAYHRARESRWRKLDYLFAWGVIVSNGVLAATSRSGPWACAGLVLVLVALRFYVLAKQFRYARRHSWWHLASGAACVCFVLGRG